MCIIQATYLWPIDAKLLCVGFGTDFVCTNDVRKRAFDMCERLEKRSVDREQHRPKLRQTAKGNGVYVCKLGAHKARIDVIAQICYA